MHRSHALNPTVPSQAIQQAAKWLVKIEGRKLTANEELHLQHWRQENEEHERAWQAAMQLKTMMGGLPAGLSKPVLGRTRMDRRQLLISISALAAALPLAWEVHQQWPALNADYRTAKGEQQLFTLPDGSQLQLNTASLVDVRFDHRQRLLYLHQGEVFITTVPDNNASKRPFIVSTPTGKIRALGTRFGVRLLDDGLSLVKVYEHAVAITPMDSIPIDPIRETRLEAGQQALFNRQNLLSLQNLQQTIPGWTRGQIIADNQRLGDFIAELARYYPGILRCDPTVADLRISGVFQLKNSQQILTIIVETLPVRISRVTDYWVTLTAP